MHRVRYRITISLRRKLWYTHESSFEREEKMTHVCTTSTFLIRIDWLARRIHCANGYKHPSSTQGLCIICSHQWILHNVFMNSLPIIHVQDMQTASVLLASSKCGLDLQLEKPAHNLASVRSISKI